MDQIAVFVGTSSGATSFPDVPGAEGQIGYPNRPATFDVRQVSRDWSSSRALATYGHPDLNRELQGVAADHDAGALTIGRHK